MITHCRVVNGRLDSGSSFTGMVQDGTKCGDSSLCQGHKCISVGSLYVRGCPRSPDTNITCSGNGVSISTKCYHSIPGQG